MSEISSHTGLKAVLCKSGLTLTTGDSVADAAQKVVQAVDAK